MALLLALLASIFFSIALGFGAMYYKQNPEAQLRKRLHDMIDQAEAERAKNPKKKKNKTPTIIKLAPSAAVYIERPRNMAGNFFRRVIRPFLRSNLRRSRMKAATIPKIYAERNSFAT